MTVAEWKKHKQEIMQINADTLTYVHPIDADVALDSQCETCGGQMHVDGYRNSREYVCVAICKHCDDVWEF